MRCRLTILYDFLCIMEEEEEEEEEEKEKELDYLVTCQYWWRSFPIKLTIMPSNICNMPYRPSIK